MISWKEKEGLPFLSRFSSPILANFLVLMKDQGFVFPSLGKSELNFSVFISWASGKFRWRSQGTVVCWIHRDVTVPVRSEPVGFRSHVDKCHPVAARAPALRQRGRSAIGGDWRKRAAGTLLPAPLRPAAAVGSTASLLGLLGAEGHSDIRTLLLRKPVFLQSSLYRLYKWQNWKL